MRNIFEHAYIHKHPFSDFFLWNIIIYYKFQISAYLEASEICPQIAVHLLFFFFAGEPHFSEKQHTRCLGLDAKWHANPSRQGADGKWIGTLLKALRWLLLSAQRSFSNSLKIFLLVRPIITFSKLCRGESWVCTWCKGHKSLWSTLQPAESPFPQDRLF